MIVVLTIGLSFVSPYFLSLHTLLDMTQFGALTALLGMGQTLVIVGGRGGIDLSVGAIVSLAASLWRCLSGQESILGLLVCYAL